MTRHGGAATERRATMSAGCVRGRTRASRPGHRGLRPIRGLPRQGGPAAGRRRADRVREPRSGAGGGVSPAVRRVRGLRLLRGGRGRPARRRPLVCTPHALHETHVRLAAEHGKAVLLEKPIACTLEEADAIARRGAGGGRRPMVGRERALRARVRRRRGACSAGRGDRRRSGRSSLRARGYRRPARLAARARGERRRAADRQRHPLPASLPRLGRPGGGRRGRGSAAQPVSRAGGRGHDLPAPPIPERRRRRAGQLRRRAGAAPLAVGVGHRHRGLARRGPSRPALWLRGRSGTRLRVFVRDRRGLVAQLGEFVAAVQRGGPPRSRPSPPGPTWPWSSRGTGHSRRAGRPPPRCSLEDGLPARVVRAQRGRLARESRGGRPWAPRAAWSAQRLEGAIVTTTGPAGATPASLPPSSSPRTTPSRAASSRLPSGAGATRSWSRSTATTRGRRSSGPTPRRSPSSTG